MSQRATAGVNFNTLLVFGAVAGALYLASKLWSTGTAVAGAVASGVKTVTAPVADVLSWWWQLDDAPGTGALLGNVIFPDAAVPLNTLKVKTDSTGGVYVNRNGTVWQLSPSNAQGNWPAMRVTGS